MHRQTVVCPYSGILLGNEKEQIPITTWMKLKDIMLTLKRQFENVTFCMIPFIWYFQKDKTIVINGCQGLGWRVICNFT